MENQTTLESCLKCRRPEAQHYEGVCLECGGMMFMWRSLDSMEEPREEVIARRIKRIQDGE